jgi:putative two-component system response regulator
MISQPKSSPLQSEGQQLLEELLQRGIVNGRELDALPKGARGIVTRQEQAGRLLVQLVDFKLLTSYQADRIRSGKVHGLMMGHYRVRDRLGVGNAGVVFRGQHRETDQEVAIKVLIPPRGQDSVPILRFFAERKTVAQLTHPGIVRAVDVGEVTSDDPDEPILYYYVMEYVPGVDLEQHVRKEGPMDPAVACDVAYQVADALAEAHRHNLVHRDIKPANILLTVKGRALLLDFGLVRQLHSRQTEPGTLLGLLEWIAPEQVKDAHKVDIRADIYSLGCTLFWCLTATSPFGKSRDLMGLASTPPPSVRSIRHDLSPELDAAVARMMAPRPDQRPATPQAVMEALGPFFSKNLGDEILQAADAKAAARNDPLSLASTASILIVDTDLAMREQCRTALALDGLACAEITDGQSALETVAAAMPDLMLLEADLPGMSGLDVLKELRKDPRWVDLKIIMLTGGAADVRPLLAAGADDYLTKPVNAGQLRSRVKTALQTKQTPPGSGPLPLPMTDVEVEVISSDQPVSLWERGRNWLVGRKKSES